MHQNSPTAIYILKKISGGETPEPPFLEEGKGRERKGEGKGWGRGGRERVGRGRERRGTPGCTHPLKILATPLTSCCVALLDQLPFSV